MTRHDAFDLARMLAPRVTALVTELLPRGHRDGSEWRCGSLAGEEGKSLAVRLYGDRAGVWADFASGESGDALDLLAAVRFGGDLRPAMDWARIWLGLSDEAPSQPQVRATPSQPPRNDTRADDAERRRKAALALFLGGREGLRGTPVADYLVGRGIDLAELGRTPRALRFHPAAWCQEVAARLPAMLGAITNGQGVHVATHRTWLHRRRDGHWTKAPLKEEKKTLGSYAGGFIPLQRGTSGRPLRTAPDGETLAIAEGIETALSVAVACPELRVMAAVSLSNMARIVLPEAISTVILCADNDQPENFAADHGLVSAIEHFASEHRTVRLARSPGGKDFNDALRSADVS